MKQAEVIQNFEAIKRFCDNTDTFDFNIVGTDFVLVIGDGYSYRAQSIEEISAFITAETRGR
jgi:hypothetical protein